MTTKAYILDMFWHICGTNFNPKDVENISGFMWLHSVYINTVYIPKVKIGLIGKIRLHH